MVSVDISAESICELVFAHGLRARAESFKFILDCVLTEKAVYFCELNVQIWRLIDQMKH